MTISFRVHIHFEDLGFFGEEKTFYHMKFLQKKTDTKMSVFLSYDLLAHLSELADRKLHSQLLTEITTMDFFHTKSA